MNDAVPESPSCILCRIVGRVQGVFFRASARDQAQRHGVTGYAHNLADGSVEALLCGAPAAVAAVRAWLHVGPPGAQVTAVECVPSARPLPNDFTVR